MRRGGWFWLLHGKMGAGWTEYLLLVALCGVLGIGVVMVFGDNLRPLFSAADNSLAAQDSLPDTRLVPRGDLARSLSNWGGTDETSAGMDQAQELASARQALLAARAEVDPPAAGAIRTPLDEPPSGGLTERFKRGMIHGVDATLNWLVPAARADEWESPLADFQQGSTRKSNSQSSGKKTTGKKSTSKKSTVKTSTKKKRELGDRVVTSLDAENHKGSLSAKGTSIDPQVMALALTAVAQHGRDHRTLTIIDMSKSINARRLWVFDLKSGKQLFNERVSHGSGSGDIIPTRFSNTDKSHMTSLGLYETGAAYSGGHGLSLVLHGLEPGFNDKAQSRAIVMHPAEYMTDAWKKKTGSSRYGRSQGCPALDPAVASQVINAIQGDGYLFIYYPDQKWLNQSRYLRPKTTAVSGIAFQTLKKS